MCNCSPTKDRFDFWQSDRDRHPEDAKRAVCVPRCLAGRPKDLSYVLGAAGAAFLAEVYHATMTEKRQFRAIKGTRDILPPDSALWNHVEQAAREVFETYGFRDIRTPIFEETSLFAPLSAKKQIS